jgi:hypothetical protein
MKIRALSFLLTLALGFAVGVMPWPHPSPVEQKPLPILIDSPERRNLIKRMEFEDSDTLKTVQLYKNGQPITTYTTRKITRDGTEIFFVTTTGTVVNWNGEWLISGT